MQYIVIEIQTDANGTVGNIVEAFRDKNQAESRFHTILAAAAVSTVPVHAAALLTNEGVQLGCMYYKHEQADE